MLQNFSKVECGSVELIRAIGSFFTESYNRTNISTWSENESEVLRADSHTTIIIITWSIAVR